ncbi:hypothetical protein ACVDG5_013830 [Mesorhizobium sp. ORM6]
MPKTAFPLSKSHTFQLGKGWRWCVLALASEDRRYRLLVAYEKSKAQYRAWLGLESGTDQALLARLEYHPSHRGWHCHLKKGLVADVGCGVVKHSSAHERVKLCVDMGNFSVNDSDALAIACRIFNVAPDAGELFE